MKKTKKYARGGLTSYGASARLQYLDDAIASEDLREEFQKKSGVTSNDLKDLPVIAFAYTDYGGDFFNKIAIEYFQENYPDNIVVEKTMYSGENAIVWGDVAQEYMDATEDYPLGFEDIEQLFYEREYEAFNDAYKDLLKDLIRDDWEFDEDEVMDWLMENRGVGYYSVLSSGQVDYSESDIIEDLYNERLIGKSNRSDDDDDGDSEPFSKGGNMKSSKWSVVKHKGVDGNYCLYNQTTGKSMGNFKSRESAMNFAKNMGSKAYERGGKMAKGGGVELYDTDAFQTKEIAEKSKKEIESYFGDRLLKSEIVFGKDDKGQKGFQVKYELKNQYAKGGMVYSSSGWNYSIGGL